MQEEQDKKLTTMDKLKKKLEKTVPEFLDSVEGMGVEELKKQVMTCEKHIYEVDVGMENEEKLDAAKDIVKEFSAPYRETKTLQQNKIKYIMHLLQEKGQ